MPSQMFKWIKCQPKVPASKKIIHKYRVTEVWNDQQRSFSWLATGFSVEWMPKLGVWRVIFVNFTPSLPHTQTKVYRLADYPQDQLEEAKQFVELTYSLGETNGKLSFL